MGQPRHDLNHLTSSLARPEACVSAAPNVSSGVTTFRDQVQDAGGATSSASAVADDGRLTIEPAEVCLNLEPPTRLTLADTIRCSYSPIRRSEGAQCASISMRAASARWAAGFVGAPPNIRAAI